MRFGGNMPEYSSKDNNNSFNTDPSSPTSRSSSSGSPSSSALAIAVSTGSDDGLRSDPSSRGTPARHPLTLPRSASSSTGGCWTCRIRRKKCDEQRQGDSCATCIRLDIQCLGWGAKRPDWLRDKAAQEAFKLEIRNRLMSAGRIRGVPRQRRSPPNNFGMPTSDIDLVRPGPPPSADAYHAGFGPYNGSFQTGYVDPGMVSPYEHSPQLSPFISTGFMDPLNALHFQSSPTSAHPSSAPPLSSVSSNGFSPMQQSANLDLLQRNYSAQMGHDLFTSPRLLQYYTEQVRKTQFPLATDSMDQTLHAVTSQDPQGAVSFAICALAALHYSRVQSAHGVSDAGSEFGDSKAYHDRAMHQVLSSVQVHGHYGELDALAAAHLTLYALMSGGMTDWQPPLDIACEWLLNSSLLVDENPRGTLMGMNPAGRLAAKLTMWLDVMSSVSLAQPPRFLALLRRLGGATADASGAAAAPILWARAPGEPAPESSVESVSGAPDVLALALAETASLSYWKGQELRRGALSVRDLVRRADTIENALRRAIGPTQLAPPLSRRPSLDVASGTTHPEVDGNADIRRVYVDIMKETAILYLATVVSGHSPAVPEISGSVQSIARSLQNVPVSNTDRALLLPIFLAGCLADEQRGREFFNGRLQAQLAANGAALSLTGIMSGMWRQRDAHGASGDWRRIARDMRLQVLIL